MIVSLLNRSVVPTLSFSIRSTSSSSRKVVSSHTIRSYNTAITTTTTTTTSLAAAKPPAQSESRSFTADSLSGYKAPSVNWYPGHIAKAERTLSETLTSADVLVEIRDARIPSATAHPKVREWTAGKPRIVVMTHADIVPNSSIKQWSRSLNMFGAAKWDGAVEDGNVKHRARQNLMLRGITSGVDGHVEDVLYVDAKRGAGVRALLKAIGRSGLYVNERRKKRGLRERPLRVAILGYPNVGKSALINRILGRRRAKSANTPGITRALQWIRVKSDLDGTDASGKTRRTNSNNRINGNFELLDSPGIIPANMQNQEDAILLAICNSIGNAAYDNQGVAAYLCARLSELYQMGDDTHTAPQWRQKSIDRYKFDPLEPMVIPSLGDEVRTRIPTGDDMLYAVAESTCYGDTENAARKILQDFRTGRMGPVCLQIAPNLDDDEDSFEGEKKVNVMRQVGILGEQSLDENNGEVGNDDKVRVERAQRAVEAAKERGLELPPMIEEEATSSGDVGKGLFDGW